MRVPGEATGLRARLRLAFGYPDATSDERARHASARATAFHERYSRGAVGGTIAAAVLGAGCYVNRSHAWAIAGLATSIVLACALVAYRGVAVRSAWMRDHAESLSVAFGMWTAAGAGIATGMRGGFFMNGGVVLQILWLFSAAVVPARPSYMIASVGLQTAAFAAPVLWLAPADGAGLFLLVIGGTAALAVIGASFHDAAKLRLFVARHRLQSTAHAIEASNAQLEQHAEDLARRVDDLLEAALAQRRGVHSLNQMLLAPAPDRTVELGQAFARAQRPAAFVETRLPNGLELAGRARIDRYLASGGFADVYVARDLASGNEIVVKVLRTDRELSAGRVKRFVLEAAAAATVRHPAIVRVLHVDVTAGGSPFLMCERVHGATLRWCLAAGPLAPTIVLPVIAVVADALAAAHAAGIVHRDVKPDNVMLTAAEPGVKLLDFGVSAWRGEDFELTGAGEVVGTLGYIAPELIAAAPGERDTSPASDIFALGMTLYECLAGSHPLSGMNPIAMLEVLRVGAITPLRARACSVDPSLADLVHDMLSTDPEDRPTLETVRARLAVLRDELCCLPPRSVFEVVTSNARAAEGRLAPSEATTGARRVRSLESPSSSGASARS